MKLDQSLEFHVMCIIMSIFIFCITDELHVIVFTNVFYSYRQKNFSKTGRICSSRKIRIEFRSSTLTVLTKIPIRITPGHLAASPVQFNSIYLIKLYPLRINIVTVLIKLISNHGIVNF